MAYLQFIGGSQTVTGSKYLVDTGKTRFLMDCGMFQGSKELRLRNWDKLPVQPSTLDHIFLTHAHIDHIGMLPVYVREGYQGPAWSTPETLELTEINLADAAHLQEEDARFANKKGFSKHKPALPLYTLQDAERCVPHLRPLEYGKPLQLSDGSRVQFHDAGHVLGSAIVEVQVAAGDGNCTSIVFSGDLGRYHALIDTDPFAVERTDYLLVESTYGNRRHPQEDAPHELAEVINNTARRGGSLVVPAFALARTQILLYTIRDLKAKGIIPDLPVYVDSPMAISVTELYCRHIEDLSAEAREVFRATGKCPILCPNLQFVHTPQESQELNSLHYPCIIISASGMATGGRVLHHLKYRLPDARNTILFVGFQAYGTRGQILKDGAREIKIHGEQIPVRAQIHAIESFSRHADSAEILRWLGSFREPPKHTYVVHGEAESSAALAEAIRKLGWKVSVPEYLSTVKIK
ncbi:MAG: MBL fold metallo-hydrolase [Acidobacteriia bacterium]|nr:MBL fold metallo-hydrolase [Terriglobia bacterium]